MNNIRQAVMNSTLKSLSCTVKKIAYRQSKDGIVISFLIHHAELPDELAVADLGTPYMMALVEIDDNDQPLPTAQDVRGILKPAAQRKEPAPSAEPLAERVAAVQRAGYLCKEKRFQTFLQEEFAGGWKLFNGRSENDDETTVKFVRWRCGVQSRSEIKSSPEAFARWQELDSGYQAWLRT